MAIVTRRLVEEDGRFGGGRIRFAQNENLPKEADELTTIGNLYDILKIVFGKFGFAKKTSDLRVVRPREEELGRYVALAERWFALLAGCLSRWGSISLRLTRLAPRWWGRTGTEVVVTCCLGR